MREGEREQIDESRRRWLGLGAAGAGSLLLAGCSDPIPEFDKSSRELVDGVDAFDRYDDIRQITANPPPQVAVYARGSASVGDGGEGLFFWSGNETASDNGRTILAPTSLPASGRWVRDGSGMITAGGTERHAAILNVRWFGAVGNGIVPDTDAIQAALNTVATKGGTLYFPPGRYRITRTLDAGASIGVRYQGGSGSSRSTSLPGESPVQSPTALVWDGDPADVLFKWSGRDCIFDGLAFQGRFDESGPRATIGFLVQKNSSVESGRAWFPSIHVTDCDVGFQCATAASDANCDGLTFGRFVAAKCTTGFKVLNSLGHDFSFLDARFEDVGNDPTGQPTGECFGFDKGGGLNVEHMWGLQTPTLLRVKGGDDASGFRIGFVKLDAQQDVPVIWLSVEGTSSRADVAIDGGAARTVAVTNGSRGEPFQITSSTVLRVRNINGGLCGKNPDNVSVRKLFKLTNDASDRTAVAMFENCCLDNLDPTTTAVGTFVGTGPKRWYLRDCYRDVSQHVRIPDIGNLRASCSGTAQVSVNSAADGFLHGAFGIGTMSDGVNPRIFITPRGGQLLWVTTVNGSKFWLNASASVGLEFYWRAEVTP